MRALTSLTRLDLQGNRLAELPEWLGELTALTELRLDGNDPRPQVPASLRALARTRPEWRRFLASRTR
ncbi:hypothetical protein GCM10010517_41460 [Streptosporangium fragile]|uniref:Leucine-rich repeat domain-containing protein n=2 Tax=Streptosporangium fragile TaxID=46186 RepID=A0ABN3W0D6_9ACTN